MGWIIAAILAVLLVSAVAYGQHQNHRNLQLMRERERAKRLAERP